MEFYSMQEVQTMLKLNRGTIKEKIDAGELKAYKTGRKYLFSKTQIEEFLQKSLTA